jgi:hypothetical protein
MNSLTEVAESLISQQQSLLVDGKNQRDPNISGILTTAGCELVRYKPAGSTRGIHSQDPLPGSTLGIRTSRQFGRRCWVTLTLTLTDVDSV